MQTLADRAALINRQEERSYNESQNRRRFVELGGLTEAEAATEDRLAFRRRVLDMQTACESLYDEVLRMFPESGPAIWARVVEFVMTNVKASSSMSVGPNKEAYEAMLEFQTPGKKRTEGNP